LFLLANTAAQVFYLTVLLNDLLSLRAGGVTPTTTGR
jgi:hypothetical protein